MKKISILLVSFLLYTGVSFAIPQEAKPVKPKTEKKADKKTVKKVPARKAVTKTTTTTKTAK